MLSWTQTDRNLPPHQIFNVCFQRKRPDSDWGRRVTQRETLLAQEKLFVASILKSFPRDLLEHGEWREALEWE